MVHVRTNERSTSTRQRTQTASAWPRALLQPNHLEDLAHHGLPGDSFQRAALPLLRDSTILSCRGHDKILLSLFLHDAGKPGGLLPATVAADLRPYRAEIYHPTIRVEDALKDASTVEISIPSFRRLVNCSRPHLTARAIGRDPNGCEIDVGSVSPEQSPASASESRVVARLQWLTDAGTSIALWAQAREEFHEPACAGNGDHLLA